MSARSQAAKAYNFKWPEEGTKPAEATPKPRSAEMTKSTRTASAKPAAPISQSPASQPPAMQTSSLSSKDGATRGVQRKATSTRAAAGRTPSRGARKAFQFTWDNADTSGPVMHARAEAIPQAEPNSPSTVIQLDTHREKSASRARAARGRVATPTLFDVSAAEASTSTTALTPVVPQAPLPISDPAASSPSSTPEHVAQAASEALLSSNEAPEPQVAEAAGVVEDSPPVSAPEAPQEKLSTPEPAATTLPHAAPIPAAVLPPRMLGRHKKRDAAPAGAGVVEGTAVQASVIQAPVVQQPARAEGTFRLDMRRADADDRMQDGDRKLSAESVFGNFGSSRAESAEEDDLAAMEANLRSKLLSPVPAAPAASTHKGTGNRRTTIDVVRRAGPAGNRRHDNVVVEHVSKPSPTRRVVAASTDPLVKESVQIVLLCDKLGSEDKPAAMKIKHHMDSLRRILSEIDFRIRSTIDAANARQISLRTPNRIGV